MKPLTGEVTTHAAAKIGHFGQTNIQRLDEKNTIIEEIQKSNPALPFGGVRAICGAMMFDGDLAKKQVKVLSGGEKSRVMLGKILANPTNLLLLDEPTNHLDMESIEELTEQIVEYEGAVIIVTHSELILRSLANKLIVFNEGKAFLFHGGYDDFLERVGWEDEPKPKKKAEKNEDEKVGAQKGKKKGGK